ncbi:MAG: hypothetical protein HYT43_01265 [Candidatus Taylorbacteria bacterium]|nr:hypothetical protein [Candidatus Taylorbacteria bacterium]
MKPIVLTFIIVFSLLTAPLSFAHDDLPRGQSPGHRSEHADESATTTAEGRKKAAIKRRAERIIKKLEAAIGRLDRLAGRIETRIAKFEERGSDMTEAKRLLGEARAKIETAKGDVTGAKAALVSIPPINRENLAKIKREANKAKESIKAAHAALADTISSLKPGRNKINKATTSQY